jgi:hypothetical protein
VWRLSALFETTWDVVVMSRLCRLYRVMRVNDDWIVGAGTALRNWPFGQFAKKFGFAIANNCQIRGSSAAKMQEGN